ncbi:hypothetical protein GOODEAATRI_021375, partial [Goodea atripinnis]
SNRGCCFNSCVVSGLQRPGLRYFCCKRDSLPANPAYAACRQAGWNLASPGLSGLPPSAGTKSQL